MMDLLQRLLLFILVQRISGFYENQPKLLANDGHLVVESALDKNITLRMKGRGYVNINDVNLMQVIEMAKNLSGGNGDARIPDDFNVRFTRLTRRVSRLESRSNVTAPPRMPLLQRRVRTLERKVTQMMTKLNTDNCRNLPCQNGGSCVNLYDAFKCSCPKNWEGPTCGQDVNECAQFSGTDLGCQHGDCVNTPGGYSCSCAPGWKGIHCTRPNVDCMSATTGELCGHGTCIQTNDAVGYKCLCEQGWKSNGASPACTEDVNECADTKPHCSMDPRVSCINLPGSFMCGACPPGYTGNGFYCADINECETNNGGCSMAPMVTCINSRGTSHCANCPPGYQGDGRTCYVSDGNSGGSQIAGRCATAGMCHPLARCEQYPNSVVNCVCPPGYAGSGFGPNGCVRTRTDPCTPTPCLNGGYCNINGTSFTCSCPAGTAPPVCAHLADPCAPNPCQNLGQCVVSGSSYRCICSASFTGLNCQTETRSCGGVLNAETGTLKYPEDGSETYQSNVRCAWLIKTNKTQVLNVTFTKFHLEYSANECRFDWLQIHDGRSTAANLIGRFCGTDLPKGGSIISTHNMLYLWFRSDNSSSHAGFEMTWNSIAPVCGGELEVTTHGTISSPGSPGHYPPNRDCQWDLYAPAGKRISFHFYTIQLEAHEDCKYDYLQIHSAASAESSVLEKFCNTTTTPQPVLTPSNEAAVVFHSDQDGTDAGFQLTYAVVEGVPGCGGTYTAPAGELSSPVQYEDNTYPHNLLCEYLIKLPAESRIAVQFNKFHLEESDECRFDYVEIFEGRSDQDPLVGRWCHTDTPPKYTSRSNVLLIKFKSDWSTSHGGFQLSYKIVCGGTFSEDNGVITSPLYPKPYEEDRTCKFEIEAPLGKAIVLDFQDFDVEQSADCDFDSVQVFDGPDSNTTSLGAFCGEMNPPQLISSLNSMLIVFNADASLSGRGFKANYSFVDIPCGGILKTSDQIFRSPSRAEDPNLYLDNTLCKWVIVAPPGEIIKLTWLTFDIEANMNCTFDYVQVFDNSSSHGGLIGRYCGNSLPPAVLSAENVLTIVFNTDQSLARAGFSATYTFLDGSKMCGGNYFTQTGVIRSPGWPANYGMSKECVWTVSVPHGRQVELNFKTFELEKHTNCRFDYLEIRNGGNDQSALVGRFCGSEIPKKVRSFSNQIYLKFVSDGSRAYAGFDIEWDGTSTGCGGVLTTPRGSITSPNYPEPYGNLAQCVWKIIVSEGSSISVTVLDLNLEEDRSCIFDNLEFFDGPDGASRSLGKYCTLQSGALQINSTGNALYLRMNSDQTHQGRGFNLNYVMNCDRVISGHAGAIESPNFPLLYPDNMMCKWTLKALPGNKLNIQFSHFAMETGSERANKCEFDYLIIQQKKSGLELSKETYCSTNTPPPFTSLAEEVLITFHSDVSGAEMGFRLEWEVEGCGGLLTHPEGVITSPNYPNYYPLNTHCEWTIVTDFDKTIEFTIEEFDVEISTECRMNGLIVSNSNDESQIIGIYCHALPERKVLTGGGHQMFVKFYTENGQPRKGFRATYKAIPSRCGGLLTMPKGLITSPNYPKNYEARTSVCDWKIETDWSHTVEVNLMDIDIKPMTGCSLDRLSIYDSADKDDNKTLARICGNQMPNQTRYLSTANSMSVSFDSSAFGVAEYKGFKLNYTTRCGSNIVANETGSIRLADYMKFDHSECVWTISAADPTQHVRLTVTDLDLTHTEGAECPQFLKVFDGDSINSPLRQSVCNNHIPGEIISYGQSLTVLLKSTNVGTGLSAITIAASYSVFDNTCGGTLKGYRGTFSSPNYPKSYPLNIECEWNIRASQGNLLSIAIQSIDIPESDNCNENYLEIRETKSSGKLLGVLCNSNSTADLINANSYWIKFRSGGSVTGKGFTATFNYVQSNELLQNRGVITSPTYPNMYSRPDTYTWRITSDYGKVVSLKFDHFRVNSNARSDGSCNSRLMLYDGYDETAPMLGEELCANTVAQDRVASTNVVFLKLLPSGPSLTTHFYLSFEAIAKVETADQVSETGCGGTFVLNGTRSQNITSPGYPHGYGGNLDCKWIVSASNSSFHPVILFHEIDLEDTNNCLSDYVTVSSSKNLIEWTQVAKLCSFDITQFYLYHGTPHLKIEFKSDWMTNKTGFHASTHLECGGNLNEPNGVIRVEALQSSFGTIRIYNTCMWNITVRQGKRIHFEFEEMNMEESCTAFVTLKNGVDDDSPLLGNGKYCGKTVPDNVPETISNRAFVKFKNGISLQNSFTLKYREVGHECGGNVILSEFYNSTIITSPNYPEIPPPHTECIWTIMAPAGEKLQIKFLDRFDLTLSVTCEMEYVEVRDGATANSRLIGRYCGKIPVTTETKNNAMRLKFFTDVSDPKIGFKAKVSIGSCGGMFTAPNGVIRSPLYPAVGAYPAKSTCDYYITGAVNAGINVTFEDISLPSYDPFDKICRKDVLIIYNVLPNVDAIEGADGNDTAVEIDSNNNTLEEVGRYCGWTKPDPIIIPTNEILIRLQTFDYTSKFRGFSLSYSSTGSRCGTDLVGDSGDIMSPQYPANALKLMHCEWKITVPKGKRVRIDVEDIDLITGFNDFRQRITFFNDHSFSSRIKSIKSDYNMDPIFSASNKMRIVFWATIASKNRGFKLRYSSNETTVCGGDLSQAEGSISAPNQTALSKDAFTNKTSYYCEYERYASLPIMPNGELNFGTLALEFKNVATGMRSAFFCRPSFNGIFVKWTSAPNDELSFLRKMCGNQSTEVTVRSPFPDTMMTVRQHIYFQPINFELNYRTHPCGGILTSSQDRVVVPRNLSATYGKLDCAWQIRLSDDSQVKIAVKKLELKLNCNDEYFLIYNGAVSTSPLIGRYCAGNSVTSIPSLNAQSNFMFIEYHSENYTRDSQLEIDILAAPAGCGGIIHSTDKTISSPLDKDSKYFNNAECIWEVTSQLGYHLGVTFTERFFLEESVNCTKDYVEFFDFKHEDWSPIGRICGRETKIFNTTSNRLKIVFRSDSQISGDGFTIKLEENCGGTFEVTEAAQIISSPGYPKAYGRLMVCNYTLVAPPKQYISINFVEFELEESVRQCNYDNLTIFKMVEYLTPPQYEVYGTYCRKNSPGRLRLKERAVLLFKTDRWLERKGFQFEFTIDKCGGVITESTEIVSPVLDRSNNKDWGTNFECMWNITAPIGSKIVIRFEKFDMEHSDSCYSDNVAVYSGTAVNETNRLVLLCGNLTEHQPVINVNSTNGVIALKSESYSSHEGFSALVLITTSCDSIIELTDQNPTYLLNELEKGYAPNLDCHALIRSQPGTTIQIEFSQFHLMPCNETLNRTGCTCDYLEVRDGAGALSPLIGRFCGHEKPPVLHSSGAVIWLRFVSDSIQASTGLTGTAKMLNSPCGLPFTEILANGSYMLESPGTEEKYLANTKCNWVLQTESGRALDIEFVKLDLEDADSSGQCTKDKLEIFDEEVKSYITEGLGQNVVFRGRSQNAWSSSFYYGIRYPTTHYEYCGSGQLPGHYISQGNKVHVKFTSDAEIQKSGFKINIQVVSTCHRNYTSLQGRFKSTAATNCGFYITVPDGYTITLYFQSIFFFENDCKKAGLLIYEGGANGQLLTSVCGYQVPDPLFSSNSSLYVQVKVPVGTESALAYGSGTYDVMYVATDKGRGCGGQIFNYGGMLTSPLYPSVDRASQDCRWEISVPQNLKLAIKFQIFDMGVQGACAENYVQFIELTGAGENVARTFCGGDTPDVYRSDNNVLIVRFKKTVNFAGTGWIINFIATHGDSKISNW